MRFLLIGSFPLSMLKFRASLIQAISETGTEVHVALPLSDEDQWIAEELASFGAIVHDIRLSRTGRNPFVDLLSLLELYRLCAIVKPYYVLSYTVKPVIYGSLAAFFTGVPKRFALITGLGYSFESDQGRGVLGQITRKMYAASLRRVDIVFFQNQHDEQLFVRSDLVREPTRTKVVNGSGVDLGYYGLAPVPDRVSFLLIARLLGAKGVREYAAAAKIVRNEYPDVSICLAGWIDEDNPDSISESELEHWTADETIVFLGKLDDVRPALRRCSVYVLPSYREGTSRTTLEAMAMGRAIITTSAPGCVDTVEDGRNGLLVPTKSAERLAEAMTIFVQDPGLARTMGKHSRRIAEEKYDVHEVNRAMISAMGLETI